MVWHVLNVYTIYIIISSVLNVYTIYIIISSVLNVYTIYLIISILFMNKEASTLFL